MPCAAAGTVTTYEVNSRTLCLPYPSSGFAAPHAAPVPAPGAFLGAMPALKGSLLSLDGEGSPPLCPSPYHPPSLPAYCMADRAGNWHALAELPCAA